MTDSIKISRSRTVTRKMASSRSEFHKAFAHLREIEYQQPAETPSDDQPTSSTALSPPPKKKKAGRPKVKKPSSKPKSSTRGKRLLPIGGSDLQSDVRVDGNSTGSTQRSVGQTCQPKTSDAAAQVIRCVKCDDLSHTAVICTGVTATSRPPPLYCH